MKRFVAVLSLLLPFIVTAALHADPLFDIRVSGDGHVLEFVTPNPGPVYDHPHAVYAFVSGTGTEDGVNGYSFSLNLIIDSRGYFGPNFQLGGGVPGSGTGFTYDLYGPAVTAFTSVPVSYNPVFQGPGYQDLLTPNFLPGDYGFRGFVGQNIQNFDVLITEETGPAVTPEPATWVLLATGAAGVGASLGRRLLTTRTEQGQAPANLTCA